MRNFKHLVIFGVVVVVAVFLAAPSAMAKKAMNEAELDLITAAGQPTIVQAVGSEVGVAVLIDVRDTELSIGDTAQTNLAALVLNNVAGENQLATALNIYSIQIQTGVASQKNEITQSWGSVKDLGAVTVTPGDVSASGPSKCVLATCTITVNAVPNIVKLTSSADQILHAEALGPDGVAVAVAFQAPTADLTIGGTAQQTLAALIVNNVAGMNQVANAVNVAAGTIVPGAISPSSNSGLAQSNAVTQYRGTPVGH